jgi:hypothetical protein
VLLDEIPAALGVARGTRPVSSLGEVLREARRPVLAGNLSSTAVRIAEILSERSEHAVEWDPSLDAETLRFELDVDHVSFVAALDELHELGWLLIRRDGEASIGPAEDFFIDAEAALGSSDPHADARRVAEWIARRPGEASRVSEIARALEWTPRRMNVALHVLRAAAPDALVPSASPGPLAYVLVLPDGGSCASRDRPDSHSES